MPTPQQYREHRASLRAGAARRAVLDARTIDEYRPGEQQSEADHGQKGEQTTAGDWQGRKFRQAADGGWFSFNVKVAPGEPVELVCTYWGGEGSNRTFDILVDGKVVATETLNRNKPGDFFDQTHVVPEELTRSKQRLEARFQARPGNAAGRLFGVRVLRGRS